MDRKTSTRGTTRGSNTRGNTRGRQPNDHANQKAANKEAKRKRELALAAIMASKPDGKVDDPADVAEIERARKNMGDYKLKSAPEYVVPPHMRMNAEFKRRQMALLQEGVQSIHLEYNGRFFGLRDLKWRIIETIKKDNNRLRELNKLLGMYIIIIFLFFLFF